MTTRTRSPHSTTERKVSTNERSSTEENLGFALGVLAGGATGAIAGPIGMAVGASIGSVIGEAAGEALHAEAVERAAHTRSLDDTIGITSGTIGAGKLEGFVEPAEAVDLLRADHDQLASFAERALALIDEGAHDEVAAAVGALQSAVVAHLDGEERYLLPAYAAEAPADAARLLKEHAAMRKTLADLDVQTDLHLVRTAAVRAFLDELRAHAVRENAGLYRWTKSRSR